MPPYCSALRATSRYVPSLSGIALITATMFSAVNSPTPRILFGMVVSGAAGVHLLRVGGCVQGSAVELSRPSGPLVCKLVGNVLWWDVWPAVRPLRAAKRAAQSSRPSWVVTVMPSDSESIVGPARLPRGSPCSDGSTYAVYTLRGHTLGTVLGSEWHGCCALVSPRCPWDAGGALIGSLQKVDRPVGRWRPAS